jgi:hypothetical protein
MINLDVVKSPIENDIKNNHKGYGLLPEVEILKSDEVTGTPFVTIGGEDIKLNTKYSSSKKRELLIQDFKLALLTLDVQKMKDLLYKNDHETPFIAYDVGDNQYVIRIGPLSIQEIIYKNPLPSMLKNYIQKNGPMRFDQYWAIAEYFPALGIYNKVRHFENYFESESSARNNIEYALGIACYITTNAKEEKKIRIVELGAGTGEGMFRLLTALKHVSDFDYEAFIVETSETLQLTQKHKLSAFSHIKWVEDLTHISADDTLTFVTCEMFFDSFPHRVFQKNGQRYFELYLTEQSIECDEKGIDETDPLIADIEGIKEWPDGSLIYRSLDAEAYFENITKYFKRFILLACDHMTPYMRSSTIYEPSGSVMYRSLHLVGLNRSTMSLMNNAGEFMMACSLYLPLYKKIAAANSNLQYKFYYAKDFFNKIGGFNVYNDYPQFVMMVVHN